MKYNYRSSVSSYCFGVGFLWFLLLLITTSPTAYALAAPPKVALLGATGLLGRQTLEELVHRKIPVKCLVRKSSIEKLDDYKENPLVEIVEGDLLDDAESKDAIRGRYDDALVQPSRGLKECIEGCSVCISCYGATRRTKFGDLWKNPEDVDPFHAKQINYRSMLALTQKASSDLKLKHIVRITGKGEDPTGFFSVLLNGLGAYCKAWNYQGEVVLRNSGIPYTIVRPGIMAKEIDGDGGTEERYLELRDNGGNDLKVTKVTYQEIASLLVEVAEGVHDKRVSTKKGNDRVTLAAMNAPPPPAPIPIRERISLLSNDSRVFPQSLVEEHKAAVRAFARNVLAGCLLSMAALASVLAMCFK